MEKPRLLAGRIRPMWTATTGCRRRSSAWLCLAVLGWAGCSGSPSSHPGPAAALADGGQAHDAKKSRVQPGIELVTEGGPIRGAEADDLRIFKAIPYAAPPLGSLRFKRPGAHPGWKRVRDAIEAGPACPQSGDNALDPVSATSEDCLTLNVWAHRLRSEHDPLRPVMVWLHGGGFTSGTGGSPLCEASHMARAGDVVVVTLNYRLGALGFLATEALRDESSDGSVGNYGLLDQRAALAWVARNIEIFGGDPRNVTLFGESAGGASVCAHMAMPESRGLFHKAIVQSGGSCADFVRLTDDPVAPGGMLESSEELVMATPCAGKPGVLTCLRAIPVEDLLTAQTRVRQNIFGSAILGPTVDGVTLPDEPYALLAQDTDLATKLIVGSNLAEAVVFMQAGKILGKSDAGLGTEYTSEDHHEAALLLAGNSAKKALDLESVYPLANYASPGDAIAEMLTEVWYTCSALHLGRLLTERGAAVFHYEFRGVLGGIASLVGASHGIDVPFTFGTSPTLALGDEVTIMLDDQDRALSDHMIGRWTAFAHEGAPNGTPTWLGASAGVYALDEQGSHMETRIAGGRCEALEELGLLAAP